MIARLLAKVPGVPPVNVQTNTKGITAWFTQEHIVGILVVLISVAVAVSFWKMLIKHPILFAILVVVALVGAGFMQMKHPSGAAPAPVVPLPKGH